MRGRTLFGEIMSSLAGFIIFIVLLVIANILVPVFNNTIYTLTVAFFNNNLLFLLLLGLVVLLGDLFDAFPFPLNLASPIFNSVAGVMAVIFLFLMLDFTSQLTGMNIYDPIAPYAYIIGIVVFFGILILGYLNIFSDLASRSARRYDRRYDSDRYDDDQYYTYPRHVREEKRQAPFKLRKDRTWKRKTK